MVIVGSMKVEVITLVASASVVVLDVGVQDRLKVPFAGDEHPVGAFGPDGFHPALGEGAHPWCLWCGFQDLDADRGEHGVEGVGEAAVAVADQVSEPVAFVFEIGGESAGELG